MSFEECKRHNCLTTAQNKIKRKTNKRKPANEPKNNYYNGATLQIDWSRTTILSEVVGDHPLQKATN